MYYIVRTKSGKHHISRKKNPLVAGAKILMVTNNSRMADLIANHLNAKPQLV